MSSTAVTTVPLVKTTDIPRYDGRLEDSALFLSVTGNTDTTMVPFSTFKVMFPSLASEPAGPGSPGADGFVALGPSAFYSYHGASWGASPRYTANWQDLTADVRFLLVNTGGQGLSDEEKGNAWKNIGLKPATTSEIGVVSIGEGLSVTEDGSVSVNRATPVIRGSVLLDSTNPEESGSSAASIAYVDNKDAHLQRQIDEWAVPAATNTTIGGIIATDTVVISETGEARVPNATTSQRGAVVLSDGTAADGVGVTTGADAANIAAAKVAELVVNATYGHPGILAPATANSGIDLFTQDGSGTGLFSVSKAVARARVQIPEDDETVSTGSYGFVMPVADITGTAETAYGNWVPTIQAVRTYVMSAVQTGIAGIGEGDFPRDVLPIATYNYRGVVRGSDTVTVDATGRMTVPAAVADDENSLGAVKVIGSPSAASLVTDAARRRVTVPNINYMDSFMDWAKAGVGSYGSVKVVESVGGTVDSETGATVLPEDYVSAVFSASKTQELIDDLRGDLSTVYTIVSSLVRYPTTTVPYASNTQAGVVKIWKSGTVGVSIASDNIPLSMRDGYLYLDASYITGLITGSGGGSVSVDWLSAQLPTDGSSASASANSSAAIAIGYGSQAEGVQSIVIGHEAKAGNASYTASEGNVAIGPDSEAGTAEGVAAHALAVGYKASASEYETVAVGAYTIASQTYALAFGTQAEATGDGSMAVGYYSRASGAASTAVGSSASTDGANATSVGTLAKARGVAAASFGAISSSVAYSTALGSNAVASGQYSLASGYGAKAGTGSSLALGAFAAAGSLHGIAIGVSSVAIGSSIAIGIHAQTSSGAVAIGGTAMGTMAVAVKGQAQGENSIAIGTGATATGASSIQIGCGSNDITNSLQVASFPLLNLETGYIYADRIQGGSGGGASVFTDVMAFGPGSNGTAPVVDSASVDSFAIGYSSQAFDSQSVVLGAYASTYSAGGVAIGFNSTAVDDGAVASGRNARASGQASVAIGSEAVTYFASGSVAVGAFSSTYEAGCVAVGYSSHAIGDNAIALGAFSVATASGAIQFGIGKNTTANTLQVGNYRLLDANGKIPADRIDSIIMRYTTQKVDLGVLAGGAVTVGFYYGSGSWDVYATDKATVTKYDAREFPDIQIFFRTGGTAPIITWETADTGDIHWLNTDGETIPPEFDTYTSYHLGVSYEFGHYVVGITYQDTAN